MRVIGALLLSALFVTSLTAAPRRRSAGRDTGKTCGVLSPSAVSLTAFGTANGCDARTGTGCDRLQPIELTVSDAQYDFSCAPHTIVWDFGDGATTSAAATVPVRHMYAEPGSFLVTADIRRDGFPSVVVQQLIKVYEIPYACAPMSAINVFILIGGAVTGCTAASGSCDVNEDIALAVGGFGYDFGCAPHTIVWNFGDGTAGVTAAQGTPVLHRFPAPGTYIISATVTNAQERLVTTFALPIRQNAVP